MMMPSISTSCWICFGTEKRAMMMTKTNSCRCPQAVLGQPAGDELPGGVPAREHEHEDGEHERQSDVDADPRLRTPAATALRRRADR